MNEKRNTSTTAMGSDPARPASAWNGKPLAQPDENAAALTPEEYASLNRTYALLSDINQAFVRLENPQELYQKACQIAVERGGFRLAWIGFLDPSTRLVKPAACAGIPPECLEKITISSARGKTTYSPTSIVLKTGKRIVANDITRSRRMEAWRAEARELGYRAYAVFPLIAGSSLPGCLNLYAEDAGWFDPAELKLLDEMAADIAFAMEFAAHEETRRKTEELLIQSEHRYETLTNISPVGIFRTEPDGYTTFVNPKWCEISGMSAQKALGNGWLEAVHPDDREYVIGGWQESTHSHRASYDEYRFLRADGSIAWVMGQAMPEKSPEGQIIGYVGTITDITERKLAEEKISKLNAELEVRVEQRTAQLAAANKSLESFSYSVSHDLRAPLRAISGFAEIISRRHKECLNEEGRHYIDNLVHASERMSELIDDLLTYARLGRSGVRHEPVALAELLVDVRKNNRLTLKAADGTVTIQENFPTMTGDRTLLALIFMNLLDNAIKYHKPGIPPQIDLTFNLDEHFLIIKVRDNGIGIPPEYHEKIFNVFQRLHSEDEYPGTGIGLATVKKSVELLGGSISVESEAGAGSTFILRIPKEQA